MRNGGFLHTKVPVTNVYIRENSEIKTSSAVLGGILYLDTVALEINTRLVDIDNSIFNDFKASTSGAFIFTEGDNDPTVTI